MFLVSQEKTLKYIWERTIGKSTGIDPRGYTDIKTQKLGNNSCKEKDKIF